MLTAPVRALLRTPPHPRAARGALGMGSSGRAGAAQAWAAFGEGEMPQG